MVEVHVNTLAKWENGSYTPRVAELQRLCAALGCSEVDLLNGPDEGKIKVTISYNWEKFEKGEINMEGIYLNCFWAS